MFSQENSVFLNQDFMKNLESKNDNSGPLEYSTLLAVGTPKRVRDNNAT
jgi:hypothetical protein